MKHTLILLLLFNSLLPREARASIDRSDFLAMDTIIQALNAQGRERLKLRNALLEIPPLSPAMIASALQQVAIQHEPWGTRFDMRYSVILLVMSSVIAEPELVRDSSSHRAISRLLSAIWWQWVSERRAESHILDQDQEFQVVVKNLAQLWTREDIPLVTEFIRRKGSSLFGPGLLPLVDMMNVSERSELKKALMRWTSQTHPESELAFLVLTGLAEPVHIEAALRNYAIRYASHRKLERRYFPAVGFIPAAPGAAPLEDHLRQHASAIGAREKIQLAESVLEKIRLKYLTADKTYFAAVEKVRAEPSPRLAIYDRRAYLDFFGQLISTGFASSGLKEDTASAKILPFAMPAGRGRGCEDLLH